MSITWAWSKRKTEEQEVMLEKGERNVGWIKSVT